MGPGGGRLCTDQGRSPGWQAPGDRASSLLPSGRSGIQGGQSGGQMSKRAAAVTFGGGDNTASISAESAT